ncbi:unnamed protein product [Arabidopsis lyrata]|nr:unnamed protein product [Arabidopsis lyrata]
MVLGAFKICSVQQNLKDLSFLFKLWYVAAVLLGFVEGEDFDILGSILGVTFGLSFTYFKDLQFRFVFPYACATFVLLSLRNTLAIAAAKFSTSASEIPTSVPDGVIVPVPRVDEFAIDMGSDTHGIEMMSSDTHGEDMV